MLKDKLARKYIRTFLSTSWTIFAFTIQGKLVLTKWVSNEWSGKYITWIVQILYLSFFFWESKLKLKLQKLPTSFYRRKFLTMWCLNLWLEQYLMCWNQLKLKWKRPPPQMQRLTIYKPQNDKGLNFLCQIHGFKKNKEVIIMSFTWTWILLE